MDFRDNTKINALIDRHLMGKLAADDLIGHVWTVYDKAKKDARIVKVNKIMSRKTGYTNRELKRMGAISLMVRDETIRVHVEKYFERAFSAGESQAMRSHGQGFQLKTKSGKPLDVWLGIVFVEEDPALDGSRMIPRAQSDNFIFGVLRVIFLNDFGQILKD